MRELIATREAKDLLRLERVLVRVLDSEQPEIRDELATTYKALGWEYHAQVLNSQRS